MTTILNEACSGGKWYALYGCVMYTIILYFFSDIETEAEYRYPCGERILPLWADSDSTGEDVRGI